VSWIGVFARVGEGVELSSRSSFSFDLVGAGVGSRLHTCLSALILESSSLDILHTFGVEVEQALWGLSSIGSTKGAGPIALLSTALDGILCAVNQRACHCFRRVKS